VEMINPRILGQGSRLLDDSRPLATCPCLHVEHPCLLLLLVAQVQIVSSLPEVLLTQIIPLQTSYESRSLSGLESQNGGPSLPTVSCGFLDPVLYVARNVRNCIATPVMFTPVKTTFWEFHPQQLRTSAVSIELHKLRNWHLDASATFQKPTASAGGSEHRIPPTKSFSGSCSTTLWFWVVRVN
jgi:hypothetical protein